MKFIAKPNTWYVPFSLVDYDYKDDDDESILEEKNNSGFACFCGFRLSQNKSELAEFGTVYYDGEACPFDEFWILTDSQFDEYQDFIQNSQAELDDEDMQVCLDRLVKN